MNERSTSTETAQISGSVAARLGSAMLGCCAALACAAALGACGGASSPAGLPNPDDAAQGSEQPAAESALPAWVFPEGGAVVDAVPSGENYLAAIDAYGNVWIEGCGGLYVVGDAEIHRYRYLDTPWRAAPVLADREGRVWFNSVDGLHVFEAGQWRSVSAPLGKALVIGSDGVGWSINHEEVSQSGWYSIASVWPEASTPIAAPRWHSDTFVGATGSIWYTTAPTAANELWHFDGQRFAGPFTVDYGAFFYDPSDDTMGIVRPLQDELIKVRYDGNDVVEVSRSEVDWRAGLGRTDAGDFIAVNDENDLLIVDGDHETALPKPGGLPNTARFNPTGALYLENPAGVYRYQEGEARAVVKYDVSTPSPRPWDGAGYASALRAASQPATASDFAPEIPDIFGKKVSITGVAYYVHFESPSQLAIDGEPVNVNVSFVPPLYQFATEHGFELQPPAVEELGGAFDPSLEAWDLVGYLEPGPCFQPGQKTFHVLEAYPASMPAVERARLAAALREQYQP